ncbi:uncharacterized protein PG998_009448 [Apiospora kogelbergensis]|uniref:uncharacterized protein n=1 Tax=Apiospora kogelbergensis TaxID=1337665 RepID=UPI00312EEA29
MSTYTSSYYLSPPQSPPADSSSSSSSINRRINNSHSTVINQNPLLSVKVIFEGSNTNGKGNSDSSSNGGSGRRVSIGFRSAQQAEQYGNLARSKTIHHTERLACKVQGRYVSLRLPSRVTEVVACLAGPGAGASRVGGFYFVFSDPILAQEWQDCLPLWRYVQGSRRKLYIERDVRDDVLNARLGATMGTPVVLIDGGGIESENYLSPNVASPISLLSPSKTTTEEVVTIFSAEGEELVGTGLTVSRKGD